MSAVILNRKIKIHSPLSVELALSRIRLTTIKAKRGIPINFEAISAAEILKEHFLKNLQSSRTGKPLSIKPGPRLSKDGKNALINTLGRVQLSKSIYEKIDAQILKSIVERLTIIIDSHKLEKKDASILANDLRKIDYIEPEKWTSSSISNVIQNVGSLS